MSSPTGASPVSAAFRPQSHAALCGRRTAPEGSPRTNVFSLDARRPFDPDQDFLMIPSAASIAPAPGSFSIGALALIAGGVHRAVAAAVRKRPR